MNPDVREQILQAFQKKVGAAHPVLWADESRAIPFEGIEVTLEIFDVPDRERYEFFHWLRDVREYAEQLLGRPVIVILHSIEATTRYYNYVRSPAPASAPPGTDSAVQRGR